MKYIDAEKLIAEIERRIDLICTTEGFVKRDRLQEYETLRDIEDLIDSLQQEQPVHSHYTKVRETKTGREFWAEYSSDAAEWYEAGTGKAYSIHKVEIVKEQPEVDLKEYISNKLRELGADLIHHKPYSFNRGLNVGKTNAYHDILNRLNARKEDTK